MSDRPPEELDVDTLRARLRRAELRASAFQDVGLALGSTLDLDQLLELILRKTAELLEADRATLYLLDEQRRRLLSRIVIGGESQSIELPLGEGIAGVVARVGQPIRVRDAYLDTRFDRTWDELTGYRTRSILAAPMKNHLGKTIGVIQVLNKRASPLSADPTAHVEFSSHDEELIAALATQAAISIDNSRLFLSVLQKNMQLVETKEQLEQRVADLKLLFDLESAMGRAQTMEDLASAVIAQAARACEAEGGGLLVDEREDGLWLYHLDLTQADGNAPKIKRVALRRGDGLIGLAMRTNQAQHWAALPKEEGGETKPMFSTRIGKVLGITIRSAVAMPLEGSGESVLGAIGLYNAKRPNGFSQDARALLRLVSANVSTAVRLFRARTERTRAERLSTIGRFLSGVMHDLKTPLTIIGGYVQLMADTPDSTARREQAGLLLRQLDAIGAMQRELLDFASGKKSLWVRKVYLVPFAEELEKEIAHETLGTKVKLEVRAEDRGTARFDEKKILRAIHNLVRNAVDAMAERGGQLTVRLTKSAGDFVVVVSDTGRGIPSEIRDRLFGSFVTAGKPGGTGLGLSIVKKVVDEHGGHIEVDTGASGTTFSLHFPQEAASSFPTFEHTDIPPSSRAPRTGAQGLAKKPRPSAPRKTRKAKPVEERKATRRTKRPAAPQAVEPARKAQPATAKSKAPAKRTRTKRTSTLEADS